MPLDQRKRLGQFFTGLSLGKLLAHLALRPDTRTVLDSMAGHGDLLDAVLETAAERQVALLRLDGVEIDRATAAICSSRLDSIAGDGPPHRMIISGNAFDPTSADSLGGCAYDLVITNPPYVRYQTRPANGGDEPIRAGLMAIVDSHLSGQEREVWKTLAQSYSGLADLSVAAWLLAAALVRPGGRLALVVPATWRSRDYADVIRYLMIRCFCVEHIIEDTQPGWFSDALVRTHLIVARRLQPEEIAKPLRSRRDWPSAQWIEVAQTASDNRSLVGAAFEGPHSEAAFATWVQGGCVGTKSGIRVSEFALRDEWAALESRLRRRRWYQNLEGRENALPLFCAAAAPAPGAIPNPIRDLLPAGFDPQELTTLEEADIEIGQGLRTGCNRFFYVTVCGAAIDGMVPVKASSLFGRCHLSVPVDAVRPVLRRQSELAEFGPESIPNGRVLVLRDWVLPEDLDVLVKTGREAPRSMPDDLASYVRLAATVPLVTASGDGRRIPELSAVRTNVRPAGKGEAFPRFWYMLPEFAPRHLPAAFVPRINHGVARVEINTDPAMLIDANFSTFWAPRGGWTRHALRALLNSAWCRTFMEVLGTPLGGGALKLEATHLRQMLVPRLNSAARDELDAAGRASNGAADRARARIDELVLSAILRQTPSKPVSPHLAKAMTDRAYDLSRARQRAA